MVVIVICAIFGFYVGRRAGRRGQTGGIIMSALMVTVLPAFAMTIFYAQTVEGGPAGSNVVLFAGQVETVVRNTFNVFLGSLVATALAVICWLIGLLGGNGQSNNKENISA